jgi:hypothetical protein
LATVTGWIEHRCQKMRNRDAAACITVVDIKRDLHR